MRRFFATVFFLALTGSALAAGIDSSTPPMDASATSEDFIVVHDESSTQNGKIAKVPFSGNPGEYLDGTGNFVQVTTGVSSFNGRTGAVVPLQTDYDNFFLALAACAVDGDTPVWDGAASAWACSSSLTNHIGDYALHLTADQNAAIDGANNPSASNVLATMNDVAAAGGGDITAVIAGTGLSGGGTVGDVTLDLDTSGVVAGTYDNPTLTVDAYGRVTAATAGTPTGTDLSVTTTTTSVTVASSSGADGTIPAATTTDAGAMTAADRTKLDSIETGATADQAWGEITGTLASQTDLQSALDAKADAADLTAHTTDTSNPHLVTAVQVGLGNVDNTADLDKPISTATQAALDAKAYAADLTAHTNNTNNPHNITATQVGLGNVDNTADLDKPISTATQAALDEKITGPTSSTTDYLAMFADTTGTLLKQGSIYVNASGELVAPGYSTSATDGNWWMGSGGNNTVDPSTSLSDGDYGWTWYAGTLYRIDDGSMTALIGTGADQCAPGDSTLQSVVAGTNVTVDNTDPLNPIISATGAGGTSYVEQTTDPSPQDQPAGTWIFNSATGSAFFQSETGLYAFTGTYTANPVNYTLTVTDPGNGDAIQWDTGGADPIDCGNGATDCTTTQAVGTTLTGITAVAASGREWTGWTGDITGSSATDGTVTLDADKTGSATFDVVTACTTPQDGVFNEGWLGTGAENTWVDGTGNVGTSITYNEDYALTGTPPVGSCDEGLYLSFGAGSVANDQFAKYTDISGLNIDPNIVAVDLYIEMKVDSAAMTYTTWRPEFLQIGNRTDFGAGTSNGYYSVQLTNDQNASTSYIYIKANTNATSSVNLQDGSWHTVHIHTDPTDVTASTLQVDSETPVSFTRDDYASFTNLIIGLAIDSDNQQFDIEVGRIWISTN